MSKGSFSGIGNVKPPKVSGTKQKMPPVKTIQKANNSKGAIDTVKTDRGSFNFKNHNKKTKDC